MEENFSEGIFILPGGFFHNGTCLNEVKLHPPNGKGEEQLGNAANRCLAANVSVLLRSCIERIGSITDITFDIVRNLLVGDRDYLVVKLRQMTFGDRVDATLTCPNKECEAKIDIDFYIKDIPIKKGDISSKIFTMTLPSKKINNRSGIEVEFRLPSGGDQEELAMFALNDELKAEARLLSRCIQNIEGIKEIDQFHIEKLSRTQMKQIEKKMAEIAPRVDLEIETKCPECENIFSFPFNISEFFINEMSANLDQLYQEVHYLAFYYHWSESEILSMPLTKRRKYLELLGDYIKSDN